MNLAGLAQRIRARRERLGLRQADLATALLVTPQAVSKWERGENAPDLDLLLPLARLLNVSVDWLLGGFSADRDVFDATVLVSGVQTTRTMVAELAPRELARWSNSICYQVTEAITAANGLPVKTMGPGSVVGLFMGNDHPLRALDAALAAAQSCSPLKLKIGLATGEVYFGPLGHPDHARPDVVGEAFVSAFAIRAWAAVHSPSGVVVCSTTAERLPHEARLGALQQAVFDGGKQVLRVCPAAAEPQASQ